MNQYFQKVKKGGFLTRQEAKEALLLILTTNVDEAEVCDFLTGISYRKETEDEILGMAEAMREVSLHVNVQKPLLDTCGTGGSGLMRFNVSTISAFILASLGVHVAKHGNKAQSGRVGSFDLLESLGANINLNPEQVEKTIEITGLGFMYAPIFHPLMAKMAPIRKKIGKKTIFNMLGPLTSPANASFQVMGVFAQSLLEKTARILKELGVQRAAVVYGHDGLDELTISDVSTVYEVTPDEVRNYLINPEYFGIKIANFTEIEGGNLERNKEIALEILKGHYSKRSQMVLLNAALGLYIYGKVPNIKIGYEMAKDMLLSGNVFYKLAEYIDVTRSV